MKTLIRSLAVSATAALAFAFPLSTQAARLQDPTVTVTIHAAAAYGSAQSTITLAHNSSYIEYAASDATNQSGNVTGTLTCNTSVTLFSESGVFSISDCSGISDPGYSIAYDYADSSYTVLRWSIDFGLINRHIRPQDPVIHSLLPLLPDSIIDFAWRAGVCAGNLANPGLTTVPTQLGEEMTDEGPMTAPCRVNGEGKAVPAGTRGSYPVTDYCLRQNPDGSISHYLTFGTTGCEYLKEVASFSSDVDTGADLFLSGGTFTGATLVLGGQVSVNGGGFSAATGIATLDGDDDDFCGTLVPHHLPHCVGGQVVVQGVTPAAYDGVHKIVAAGDDSISFQLSSDPGQQGPKGGTFQYKNVSIPVMAGANIAHVVMNSPATPGN